MSEDVFDDMLEDEAPDKKYVEIRKAARVESLHVCKPVKLCPDDFRSHENNPYTGDSDEEFLEYIKNFDWSDIEGLDWDAESAVQDLFDSPPMEEIWNSTEDGADEWFELGKTDESCVKAGGFDVELNTHKKY